MITRGVPVKFKEVVRPDPNEKPGFACASADLLFKLSPSVLKVAPCDVGLAYPIVLSQAEASHNDDHESAGVTAQKVAEFSAGVADALARLQVMRQELIDLRENRTLAREFAAVMITRMAELDGKFANVSGHIDAFAARVSTARASCAELGRSVHRWTTFTAATLVLVLLWFGVSQIGMMMYGWRFARLSSA